MPGRSIVIVLLMIVQKTWFLSIFLQRSQAFSSSSLNGICAIYKPKQMSSADVVGRVKYILSSELRKRTGDPKLKLKVGHGGTLDPLAEGVLVLGIGNATKSLPHYLSGSKSYIALAHFGEHRDSLDSEGVVIAEKSFDHITTDYINQHIPQFTGSIQQIPPMYSALKFQGKRLYELARKGEVVERTPRTVEVYSLQLLSNHPKTQLPQQAMLEMSCSGGFYVRTLVSDLAEAMGTVAYMKELVRSKQGPFTLEHCLHSIPNPTPTINTSPTSISPNAMKAYWRFEDLIENMKQCQRILDQPISSSVII